MSFLRNLFLGKKDRYQKISNYTPEQTGMLNQIASQAMGQLGGNQFDFAPIEQQARSGFQKQTIPSLAERFSSMGGQGGQRSSAFQGALGQAGSGLEEQLAAMKQQYNLQRIPQLQQLLGMGLQPQFQTLYQPGSQGLLSSGLGSLSQLLPLLLSQRFGNQQQQSPQQGYLNQFMLGGRGGY